MSSGLKFIEETTWESVHDAWQAREEEVWRSHYENRGFKTWEAWRHTYMHKLHLPSRHWRRFEIVHPQLFIPTIYSGAFPGWKDYYPAGKLASQYKDFNREMLSANKGIAWWMNHPPEVTEVMLFTDGEKFVHFDGAHRFGWVTLLAMQGKKVPTRFIASVAEFAAEEADLFAQTYTQHED